MSGGQFIIPKTVYTVYGMGSFAPKYKSSVVRSQRICLLQPTRSSIATFAPSRRYGRDEKSLPDACRRFFAPFALHGRPLSLRIRQCLPLQRPPKFTLGSLIP